MTVNNDAGPSGFCNWNEYNLNPLTRNDWRASLVPAAAVIPAPIAYIKVVAVKKLVVGCKTRPLVDRKIGLMLLRLNAGDDHSRGWWEPGLL